MKGLEHSKRMSKEERTKTFWHIVNNKRMFNALIDIVPYYFAWMLAAILLINVSHCFIKLIFNVGFSLLVQRSYGRPCCIMIILAVGAYEGFTKIYFGVDAYKPIFTSFHLLFPDNYTISEALKVLRACLPLFM